jgi:hypothetical protein
MKITLPIADLNRITFEPLTLNTWDKFEQLFGPRGACGNCWCMYYRLKKSDFRDGITSGIISSDYSKAAVKNLYIIINVISPN